MCNKIDYYYFELLFRAEAKKAFILLWNKINLCESVLQKILNKYMQNKTKFHINY